MKKKISIAFIIAIVLFLAYEAWLYAYYNQKSNDNLPGLQSISEMEEADINEIVCGYKRTQLNYMWEEPYEAGDNEDISNLIEIRTQKPAAQSNPVSVPAGQMRHHGHPCLDRRDRIRIDACRDDLRR